MNGQQADELVAGESSARIHTVGIGASTDGVNEDASAGLNRRH